MQAGGEERDRNAVARVLVVVRAASDVRGWPAGSDRVVEYQAVPTGRIDPLHEIPQLGREAARPDQLQVARAAVQRRSVLAAPRLIAVGAPADHVHVELRRDGIARHRGVVREVARAQQPLLLTGVPYE